MNEDRIKLTENFYLDEFACKCCEGVFGLRSSRLKLLVERLQGFRDWMRDVYGIPVSITITSGSRCLRHHQGIYEEINAAREKKGLGPVPVPMTSRHLKSNAADIQLRRLETGEILLIESAIEERLRILFKGYGKAMSLRWAHVDVRRHPAYWEYADA